MKLQIALDTVNTAEALSIVGEIKNSLDIVEIGTPMIIHYGMEPVTKMAAEYPELTVLADTKIMDAGEFEAEMAFHAGAGIVTVMGVTHDETVAGAVKAAKKYNGKIMADMMCAENLEERARQLVSLGVAYICVHTAVDVQNTQSPYDSLVKIQQTVGSEHCAIAGGLNASTVEKVVPYQPEVVIVGNGITGQADRKGVAESISKMIK